MATITLHPRSTHRASPIDVSHHARSTSKVAPARLQEVEERLLASAIERHPNGERAITHLLSDIERKVLEPETPRRVLPGAAVTVERMEDLLFDAVMRTHPNREIAIDRLLGDVVGDAAIDDECEELAGEDGLALSEMRVDNDFDGMG